MRHAFFALTAMLAFAPSTTLAEPDRAYEISIVLADEGVTLGAPSLRLVAGHSAQMEAADRYRINATLTQTADGNLLLEADISRPTEAGWVVEARPRMTLRTDGQAEMRSASAAWDTVQVSIRPAA